ncbi:Ankyrin repeat-containing domain containing protein [Trema orientale]|uniref:Ankyrin repeat-containing domain containing protein n=1 Tax=Trema orientale TaxID=63057 RepID=A0A2P5ERY0_TREOI|nr:Ankyrin repeat-containing domain containing protein [Trema orientale]
MSLLLRPSLAPTICNGPTQANVNMAHKNVLDALHVTCENKRSACAKQLYRLKLSWANMKNDRGELSIRLAFASRSIDLVDWILEGDKTISRFKGGEGNSFLHIVCQKENQDLAKRLISLDHEAYTGR